MVQPIFVSDLFTRAASLPPLERKLLSELREQGKRGLSAMDVMRLFGLSGSSFTKRLSVLRQAGIPIGRIRHKDPLTDRYYSRYRLVGV